MPNLITMQEVAEYFPGRSVRWVREFLVRPARVESVRLSRKQTFVVRASLQRYLDMQTKHVDPHKILPYISKKAK